MKLIIEHYLSDGCTYSCTDTIPVDHESPEALLCEIGDWAVANKGKWDVYWRGTGIYPTHVTGEDGYHSIGVFTLEEWWEIRKI